MEEKKKTLTSSEDYRNKVMLAPMVRVGTLPFRLLSLENGADIAFVEEIIDKKIIKTDRVFNDEINAIEYVMSGVKGRRTVVFSTCSEDHPNVFQLGTASSVYALQAATQVVRDVDAIDVNMGCPKHFSLSGGMGAALLTKPETAKDIISTLKRNLTKPVTAKIRLHSSEDSTISFLQNLESAGADAITIHARTTLERPHDPAHQSEIKSLLAKTGLKIPVIYNGDIFSFDDIDNTKKITGTDSVMIARGAIQNPGIFNNNADNDLEELIMEYLRKCVKYDVLFQNAKYTVLKIMASRENGLKDEKGKKTQKSKSIDDICIAWDLDQCLKQRRSKKKKKNVIRDKEKEMEEEEEEEQRDDLAQTKPAPKKQKIVQ